MIVLNRKKFDVLVPPQAAGGGASDGGGKNPSHGVQAYPNNPAQMDPSSPGKGSQNYAPKEEKSDKKADPSKGDKELFEDSMKKVGKMSVGGLIDKEDSKEIQEELGVPVELPGEEDLAGMAENAYQHIDKLESNRASIGGRGDGYLKRKIASLRLPKVDWRKALKRYIGKALSGMEEYMGSRRHLHAGNYFVGDRAKMDGLSRAAVAVDVTGSVQGDFPEFLAEVVGISQARQIQQIHVLPFAESVHDVVVIKKEKPRKEMFEDVRLGGGTENIQAIKDYVKKNLGNNPAFCVIITDGYLTSGLAKAPEGWGKRTIWVVFENPSFDIPPAWGRIVHVNFDRKQ